jgi:sugar/nucleoside kinase (ribokinase family)
MIYLIGNPTRDTISIGNHTVQVYGGTVWYAALFLLGLGCSVAVIGKGDAEIKQGFERHGADVRYFSVEGPVAVFENIYTPGGRRQRARPGGWIPLSDLPPEAFTGEAILAGPVLQEIDPAILTTPRTGTLMLDAQGFLRHLQPDGHVVLRMAPAAATAIGRSDILKVDAAEAAVIVATADLEDALHRLHKWGPGTVIITQGEKGACLFDGKRMVWIAAPDIGCVDPTGAGDVFDAAFLIRFLEGGDPVDAGRFAVAAAALSTRGFGVTALPSKTEIERLIKRHFKDPKTVHVRNVAASGSNRGR